MPAPFSSGRDRTPPTSPRRLLATGTGSTGRSKSRWSGSTSSTGSDRRIADRRVGFPIAWLDYHGAISSGSSRATRAQCSPSVDGGAGRGRRLGCGLILAGLRVNPWKPLTIEASTAYGIDTYNTAFAQADYTILLADRIALTVGAQYHDQRSVGDEVQIKTRAALIDIEGTSGILPDIRLILNWPLLLL